MLKQATNLVVWLVSGALLLGALGIVVFATPLFGNRALIVRSGSMEPAISVGDVVIVRSGEYQTGDAIAYNVPGREDMVVTHRIVEANQGEYVTKGDANPEVDSWVITGQDIIGEELFTVPWVGTLLAFAKSRVGFVSLVVLPALVVVLSEVRVIWREVRKKVPRLERAAVQVFEMPTPPARAPKSPIAAEMPRPVYMSALSFVGDPPPPIRTFVDGVVRRGVGLAALLFMFSIMTPATFALYADSGTSSNNVFTASEDFGGEPESPDVVINEIMWMGSTTHQNDEWLELRNMTADPIDLTDWQIINAGAGTSHIILSGTIPGNGFFLISNFSPSHPNSALKNTLTTDAEANVSFLDTGEQLTLQDDSAAIIDRTPVPPPAWAAGVDSTNKQSMERNDTPGDGTVGSNWHTCTDAGCNDGTFWDDDDGNNYGTPKAANL